MNILSLLAAENYVVVNKTLAILFGNDAAILIGRFASLQKYNKGEFYRTFKKIESDINIKETKARSIITMLIEENILNKESRGLPRKVYYTLNEEILFNIMLNPPKSAEFRPSKSEGQELRRTRYKNVDLEGSLYKDENTGIKTIHKELTKEEQNLQIKFSKVDTIHLKLAKILSKITKTETPNISKITISKLYQWADDFRKLIEIDGVVLPQIKLGLNYLKNQGNYVDDSKYFMVIQSGAAFRKKWDKVASKLDRKPNNNSNKKFKGGAPANLSTVDYKKAATRTAKYGKKVSPTMM